MEDFEKTIPLRTPAGFESKKPSYPKNPGFGPGNLNSFAVSKPWVCLRLKATRNDAQQDRSIQSKNPLKFYSTNQYHTGVSKNSGTMKWMVKIMENLIKIKWMI